MFKFLCGASAVIGIAVGSTFIEGGYIGHALIFLAGFISAIGLTDRKSTRLNSSH